MEDISEDFFFCIPDVATYTYIIIYLKIETNDSFFSLFGIPAII